MPIDNFEIRGQHNYKQRQLIGIDLKLIILRTVGSSTTFPQHDNTIRVRNLLWRVASVPIVESVRLAPQPQVRVMSHTK